MSSNEDGKADDEQVIESYLSDDVEGGKLSDEEIINSMSGVEWAIGDHAARQCAILGKALVQASITFDIPKVDQVVYTRLTTGSDDPEEEESRHALMARFALVGYAIRNCVNDGFSLSKGFLNTPDERADVESKILTTEGRLH